MTLDTPIEKLIKIQKPQIAALLKLGINTMADLLMHFPYRFLDFSTVKLIKELIPEENVSIKVTIKSISSRYSFRGRMSLAEAVVSDESGSIKVVWFNQPYLSKSLKNGDEIFLAGKPVYYKTGIQLTNPLYEKSSSFPLHTARLVPLYHLNQSLYLKTFRNFVAQVLPLAGEVKETLPTEIIKKIGLVDINSTIKFSHFPESTEQAEAAKKRLAFEEVFINQLAAQKYKILISKKQAPKIKFDQSLVKSFVESLPFKLTSEQKKAAWEILQDLEKTMPMNRLLEGDVGSGKTLVALISALQTVDTGFQAALMAPTEILAKQHFETAKKFLENRISVGLLTNSASIFKESSLKKSELQNLIRDGEPGLFIGTQALLQEKVKFKKLGLAIIDEQHRFGVDQRAKLIESNKKIPHLLSLTATPIPRTLKLAFYGELDISIIKEKPAGRKPIETKLFGQENRTQAYDFIATQVKLGRQAFVVTPLIDESDRIGKKSASKEAENLRKIFPALNIGLLHGRMSGKDKERVMSEFLEKKINILVSTSVVEVGVDVPNASVMVIEGAQSFGLAQLHQFRGRVGRADHQSYCFLFSDSQSLQSLNRLEKFSNTSDGFKLAELDLEERGFGEIYGQEQSGWNFKYFDPSYTSLIEPARNEAKLLVEKDLNLKEYPILKKKIEGKIIHFE